MPVLSIPSPAPGHARERAFEGRQAPQYHSASDRTLRKRAAPRAKATGSKTLPQWNSHSNKQPAEPKRTRRNDRHLPPVILAGFHLSGEDGAQANLNSHRKWHLTGSAWNGIMLIVLVRKLPYVRLTEVSVCLAGGF